MDYGPTWKKSESLAGGHDRWSISYGEDPNASVRVTIGHDSGPPGALGLWGHNSIGPTIWHFDGGCVHLPDRARTLGEVLLGVLGRRDLAPALVWNDDEPWGHFTSVKRALVGDFDLMVRSSPMVITNGRRMCGGVTDNLRPNEECVDCWAWWVSIMSEDGARELWRLKSWCSIRDVRAAMSYAERVVSAFAAEGFGREEIISDSDLPRVKP